jgi:hypothetical protein
MAANSSAEAQLESNMPEAIRPPRAHLINGAAKTTTTTDNSSNGKDDSPPPEALLSVESLPAICAYMYYCSPATMLASGAYCSIGNVSTVFLLWAVQGALMLEESAVRLLAMALSLQFACLLDELWYAGFAVPVFFLQTRRATFLFVFALSLATASYVVVPESQFGSPPTSMSPNLSPQWYFWMQCFDRFRPYFAIVFQSLPWILMPPLSIRLHRYPIVLVCMACYTCIG